MKRTQLFQKAITLTCIGLMLTSLPAYAQGQKPMESPRLLKGLLYPTVQGDENWDNQFGRPGISGGPIYELVVDGDDILVGGDFKFAGGISANNIAKWNVRTRTWSALGDGVNGPVFAIATMGQNVYVGGNFNKAGEASASNIAKWDGSHWSSLADGVNSRVYAVAVNGKDVFVGGAFRIVGKDTINNIAKWDGNNWHRLGKGVNSAPFADNLVLTITNLGNDIYVGGIFEKADSIIARNIAKWNGVSWSALGGGVNDAVFKIIPSENELYVGGVFSVAGGKPANRIAKWNGSDWSAFGKGVDYNTVRAIAINGSQVYVGGDIFSVGGGTSVNFVAEWSGSDWVALGTGTSNPVFALAVNENTLYAGGEFAGVTKWNGSDWFDVNNSVLGAVYAISANEADVYVGGQFFSAGGNAAHHIARWNRATNSWSSLGSGVAHQGSEYPVVLSIVTKEREVYIGGNFTQAGGLSANNIAKWDGNKWSALGDGTDAPVTTMTYAGNDLYAGGYFKMAGGLSVNGIAKWNGVNWSALSGGVSDGVVNAIASNGKELYVGGDFTGAGGISANRIAKWDGARWSPLGSGLNDAPSALAVGENGELYVGGNFIKAGNIDANFIAQWNSSTNTWSPLGSGIMSDPPWVLAIATKGKEVFIGGSFTVAGGLNTNLIAKWNGSGWSTLGSGLNGSFANNGVYTLAVIENEVYAGGTFTLAGNTPSLFLARWNEQITSVEDSDKRLPQSFILYQNFPNPFNPTTTIRYVLPKPAFVTLKVFDLQGREVKTLINARQTAGQHHVIFEAKQMSSGVYLYHLQAGEFAETKKLIFLQ